MLRLFVFFAVLLGLAFGLSWLADQPGNFALSFGGRAYEVSLLVGFMAIAALSFALMLIWSLSRFIFRIPGLISLSNRMRRRSKGLAAVAQGMVAVGSGDARGAERQSTQATRLLGNEPLTLLLKAQSAQLAGKRVDAEAAFTKMLEAGETRVLGLRGLFVEARRRGDAVAARQYAEEAHKLAPTIPWASQSVLEYASGDGDWSRALGAVEQGVSRRVLAKPEGRRHRAVLLCAKALDMAERNPDEAQKIALEALKLEPGLVPAAVLAGRQLSAKGNYTKASRVIEAAWKEGPHPDLADAYLDTRRGDSALDRLKRAKNLAKLLPDNRESRFITASAALHAREFELAREQLDLLVMEKPTARACLLMAELEEQEHNRAGAMREWLARAARAPRDPAWVADGHVSEHWAPVSPVNGHLDAYIWREPPQSIDSTLRTKMGVESLREPPPEAQDITPVADRTPVPEKFGSVDSLPAIMPAKPVVMGSRRNAGVTDTKPQPIIFPVAHAPDDPGLDAASGRK